MGIPILGPVLKIVKAAAGILGVDSVKDIFDAVQNNKLTPEQRVALEQAVLEHEQEMERLNIEAMKVAMQESLAMVSSEDKFTKRARPFGLYSFYVASLALVAAQIAGATVDPAAILTILAPLAGVGGTYVYKRTQEKMNGGSGE
jgi:Holin of 3TMs, for gene-transfer release